MIEVQEDAFLDGRLSIAQPKIGYRAGMDALLLAAAITAEPGQSFMEAGCGAGVALLAAAQRLAQTQFLGIEKHAETARLAKANVDRNGLGARVRVVQGDCLQHVCRRRTESDGDVPAEEEGVFDGIFCNPPYDEIGGTVAPLPAREHAYRTSAPVEVWIKALANRLRGGAALTLIHRAHHLPAILAALEGRLGGVEVFPIRARAGEAAKRVLVRACKGSRGPLRLYAGLDLHDETGAKHSAQAQALWCGGALEWR